MKQSIIEKIIEFFKGNEYIFNSCIEELDGYNGYLNDNRYYSMEDLDEFYSETKPLELLNRVYYGRDDDTWTIDANDNKTYGEFNPNREYFYHNGCGNLVSSDYKDYTMYLDNYTIESMIKNRNWIGSIEDEEELSTLFDELEDEEVAE